MFQHGPVSVGDQAVVPSRWRLEELDQEVLLTSALALA